MAKPACRGVLRMRPKKRLNRYDPGNPDWKAVHSPWARPRVHAAPTIFPDSFFASMFAAFNLGRARARRRAA